MKEQIATHQLAKLYEKQGYLKDSLTCYQSLYKETEKEEFAEKINEIREKLNLSKNESINKPKIKSSDTESENFWKKPSEYTSEHRVEDKADPQGIDDKSKQVVTLFEQWVNMIVLERKIQNFKKIQVQFE